MKRSTWSRTSDGVFDLNTRVNLDKVVAVLLVDQELCSSCVLVSDMLGQLDGIVEDSISDRGSKGLCRGNLDNLLVTTLDRAITLEEMDDVSSAIGQKLDLNVTGLVQETLNEHGAVTECLLGLRGSTLESLCEIGLAANHTHTSSTTSHSCLDNNWEAVFYLIIVQIACMLVGSFFSSDSHSVFSPSLLANP